MHCLAETELFVCLLLGGGGRGGKKKGGKSPNFPSTLSSSMRPPKVPEHRGQALAPPRLCRQSPAGSGRFSGRPPWVKRETEAPKFSISLLCAGHLLDEARSRRPPAGLPRGERGGLWGGSGGSRSPSISPSELLLRK